MTKRYLKKNKGKARTFGAHCGECYAVLDTRTRYIVDYVNWRAGGIDGISFFYYCAPEDGACVGAVTLKIKR